MTARPTAPLRLPRRHLERQPPRRRSRPRAWPALQRPPQQPPHQERLRLRDEKLRLDKQRADADAEPHRVWPPPPPPAGRTSAPSRLRLYYEHLDSLTTRIEVCANCKQKGVQLGLGDDVERSGSGRWCWFCRAKPDVLRWKNGLDLDLSPTAKCGVDTATTDAARKAYAALQKEFAPLSPIEEALISPVMAIVTVVKLPAGGQLAFRGSVINFTLDVGKVRRVHRDRDRRRARRRRAQIAYRRQAVC